MLQEIDTVSHNQLLSVRDLSRYTRHCTKRDFMNALQRYTILKLDMKIYYYWTCVESLGNCSFLQSLVSRKISSLRYSV